MAGTVCKSKSAALAALDAMAGSMTNATFKEALLAIKNFVDENVRNVLMPEEIKAKMALLFQGTEGEQKGRAWVEREMKDPAYKGGTELKCDASHRLHKMINEPEHGAELECFWNAQSKTWEPCQPWPPVSHKRKAKGKGDALT